MSPSATTNSALGSSALAQPTRIPSVLDPAMNAFFAACLSGGCVDVLKATLLHDRSFRWSRLGTLFGLAFGVATAAPLCATRAKEILWRAGTPAVGGLPSAQAVPMIDPWAAQSPM